MSKVNINHKNSKAIEFNTERNKAHLDMILVKEGVYCIVSTFVDDTLRGQGVGKVLYKAAIDYIKKQNAKFYATCPYAAALADEDKSIKDIYIKDLMQV
ncbi:MAG: N-acetyltransferase [Mycoplasmataceae bacterium]|jgi:predicted GNAT family acetyltransferase|nr:N-acetyltransferase [Mycoplasmataceae bacterium]